MMKSVEHLVADDFKRHPVWCYDARREMFASPVTRLPVSDVTGCIVGTDALLASGRTALVVLSNLSLKSIALREQFLCVYFLNAGRRYTTPRYFDEGWDAWRAEEIADFLGKPDEPVFPIRVDLSLICVGADDLVRFSFDPAACDRLSDDERLDLIMTAF